MCRRIYKEQTTETGEVPFFKIGTFGGCPDAFITNELFEQYREQYPFPKTGMPLISAAGSVGRTVIYQGERAYYQDSNIVWLDHDENLKDSFLAKLYEQMDWNLEGSTIKRLYNKDILNAEAVIPELPEQRKIGAFFSVLDNLITLHQRKCQYRSLRGYLSWEQRKLGEVAHRVIRKNEGNQSDLPLTISAQRGLVDQRDYFNNQVASRDMSGYYLLEKGEFAYNKSTSGDSPWGAIKRLTKYEKGCLSTLYICFGLDQGDPDFFVTYYETNRWHGAVQIIAAEGARNHGLLNIAPDDFFETALTLPCSTEEQKQIGCFFTQLDALITLHQ